MATRKMKWSHAVLRREEEDDDDTKAQIAKKQRELRVRQHLRACTLGKSLC